ncbi:homoserine O-acetyltransferase/O-succinyltransferase family protein [Shigella flexneri]
MIVTGAPLGLVEFNDVAYWPQIQQVLEWAKDHVTSTLFVCWRCRLRLIFSTVFQNRPAMSKLSGVYEHNILHPHALLTRGFDDTSSHRIRAMLTFRPADRDYTDLEILAKQEGDAYLFASKANVLPSSPAT